MEPGTDAGLKILTMGDLRHTTVLLEEAVEALSIVDDGIYIDGTYGRGGHSRAILQHLSAQGKLWVIDKDPVAIEDAGELKKTYPNLGIYRGSFKDIQRLAEDQTFMGKLDGLLLDLGVSSPQLDDASRGFSFMKDGPLDMRMDPDAGLSAADWLHQASLNEITDVLKRYGEERFARRIATAICEYREEHTISTTQALVEIIEQATPVKDKYKHPATRSFQAIRIYLNEELDDLRKALDAALEVLKIGGRLVIISFHSLEDRIVKRFIRDHSRGEQFPPGMAVTEDMLNRRLKAIGKAIKASAEELEVNSRSRSAVMRVAEKLA